MNVISYQLFSTLIFFIVSQMSDVSICLRSGFLGGESHTGSLWRRPSTARGKVKLDQVEVVGLQFSFNKDFIVLPQLALDGMAPHSYPTLNPGN